MTVNELLVLMKMVRERLNQLKSLASQVSTKEYTVWAQPDREKTVEPQYDLKLVDRKVVELETWLYRADSAVKQSNATTQVTLDVDVDKLLAPLD